MTSCHNIKSSVVKPILYAFIVHTYLLVMAMYYLCVYTYMYGACTYISSTYVLSIIASA